METGKVVTKGQLVIPARIRRRYRIKTGTRVRFVEREGEIALQPVTSAVRALCGILKSETPVSADLIAERARDREREDVQDCEVVFSIAMQFSPVFPFNADGIS